MRREGWFPSLLSLLIYFFRPLVLVFASHSGGGLHVEGNSANYLKGLMCTNDGEERRRSKGVTMVEGGREGRNGRKEGGREGSNWRQERKREKEWEEEEITVRG